MELFRILTAAEEADFRKWARDNYKPGDAISSAWHPVVIHEIGLMVHEQYNLKKV